MRVAAGEQRLVGGDDRRVDPRLGPVGACLGAAGHHGVEGAVGGDAEALRPQHLGEAARQVEAAQRQYPAQPRLDPEHVGRVAVVGHRKDAKRIGAQQHLGVEALGHACVVRGNGGRWQRR